MAFKARIISSEACATLHTQCKILISETTHCRLHLSEVGFEFLQPYDIGRYFLYFPGMKLNLLLQWKYENLALELLLLKFCCLLFEKCQKMTLQSVTRLCFRVLNFWANFVHRRGYLRKMYFKKLRFNIEALRTYACHHRDYFSSKILHLSAIIFLVWSFWT